MSTENIENPVESPEDDLDTFAAELFSQSKPAPDTAKSEDTETDDEDSDATTEDTQTDEDDTLDSDEDTEEAEDSNDDESEEDKPQPKKETRAEKRIRELNTRLREAERREQAVIKRLEEAENQRPEPKNEQTKPSEEVTGPAPTDTNEDGTEKYPLGEFDPNYIRDLTKYTLQQEREALKAEEAKETQKKQYEAEREALNKSWSEKLGPAQERYPDFQEKGEELYDTFAGIDQSYGEYLTATLMSMDYGPDVLYYLGNNLDEANKIVASGPTKATIALGRLEAKFADAEAVKTKARPKVSKAPVPPATLKGIESVQDVPDDTDDLDAFSRKLFKKK